MSHFFKLKIKEIHRETDKCVTLSFDVPSNLEEQFVFKAGQYLTLKTVINNEEVRRDYSICSSPNSGNLTVAVKEVDDGIFSKFANKSLSKNDVLDVASPKGRFILQPNKNNKRTVVAFAAGSGITPIMSITKTLLDQEPESKMVLIYGNKTIKDTIFFNDLLNLKDKYPERFELQFIFSRSREEEHLFGRIEKSTVNYIVKNKYKDINIDSFYICGPEPMINVVKEVLTENGVDESNILFELFTTQNSDSDSSKTMKEGDTKATIIVDDEEFTFVMSKNKSVLESALKENVDAPYSCQGGICSSCIARIKSGEIEMRQNNILTDDEVSEGLILTCQSYATTDTITVDYDDV